MKFRTRLFLAFVILILLPLLGFAYAVRREMSGRLTAQYERRVESLIAVIEEDLRQEATAISRALAGLADAMREDNRFRRAAVDRAASERLYLLDYASRAMRVAGLSMLQIQDESGRILSSGHFRNEFDRLEPELPELLPRAPGGAALVEARSPEASFIALAGVDSIAMGGRRFILVGGVTAQGFLERLEREAELAISLHHPLGVLGAPGIAQSDSGPSLDDATRFLVRELDVPFIDVGRRAVVQARIRVSHPLTELVALRRSIDRWFIIAAAATVFAAVILANWLSARMSRPLVELARKTSRVDLDRLDVDFYSRRKDEIGTLSRLLGGMMDRLRASTGRIKEAERRATLGELARQVNHDIKNGLIPIRNVFRHLGQVAKDEPDKLPQVFAERRRTIDSSVAYLEDLASNYARLSPRVDVQRCDVNEVARQVVADAMGPLRADIRLEACEGGAIVMADPVMLRRILENLVDNAIESLESTSGVVAVVTETMGEGGKTTAVRISVADSGSGIEEADLDRVFDDFYTTKEDGTGLGLSIVRRLVRDLNGSVKVESRPGKGTRFTIELPGVDLAGQKKGQRP